MSPPTTFGVIFLATVLVTRIALWAKPVASPTIRGFRMHHYMYGIALAIIGAIHHSVWFYAIGLGLFVDELGYLCIGGKTHADNYSDRSLFLTCFFAALTFIFREELVRAVLP